MKNKVDVGIVRSIDAIGRLVIPIELRRELGLNTGEPVHMYVEDGKVIVEKYKKKCFICGQSAKEYTSIHNKRVCNECKDKLNGFDNDVEFDDDVA